MSLPPPPANESRQLNVQRLVPPLNPTGGTVYVRPDGSVVGPPPAPRTHEHAWFRRAPNGGTVFQLPDGGGEEGDE